MRFIIAIIVAVLAFSNLNTYAGQVDKPRLLIFYSNSCGHCQQMQQALQQNPSFVKDLESRYQVSSIEINSPEGQAVAQHWKVSSVPAMIINTPQYGIDRINGFSTLDRLKTQLLRTSSETNRLTGIHRDITGTAALFRRPKQADLSCNSTIPHPDTPCLRELLAVDSFCCTNNWDNTCEQEYQVTFQCSIQSTPLASQTLCVNTSAVPLSFSISGSGFSYQWYSSNTPVTSNSSGTLINGAQSTTYSPPTSTSGTTYYYAIATGDGKTQTTSIASVFVQPLPAVTVTGNSLLSCTNPSLTLTATASTTALRWSTGQTTATISVSQTGTYSVTATGANGCTALSNNLSVTEDFNLPPFTISSATVCTGQTINLTASGCSGQILWSTGATTAMITLTAGSSTSALTATCTVGS
ncbi:thioredoxin family protein, partial [Arsenicibacter rosenii]|uniref:thioredoxin family protein n=1 Tax=Arsenicibacter rosenii TaxID=1750698 RepID=UPI0015A55120